MTYKHKLARRLAISRTLRMVPVLLLLAACNDAVTGPDTGLPQLSELTAVVPAAVTIQSNQRIRFHTETAAGRVFATRLTWKASGGSITADGVFSATAPGIYKVVGRGRGRHRPDTSTVTVVPPPSDVVGIQVSPGLASLESGTTRTFTAMARLADGSSAAAGVTWAALGGSIDAGGVYQAGATPGTFAVVATWVGGALADTARVTITPPGITPPLTQVIIKPSTYTLSAGGTKQFRPYGRNSLGDSVAVQATFSATGGTISPTGVYSAGATPGNYRVIASASGLADTAPVTLTPTSTSTLTDVVVKPASYSMTTGTSKQFSAYGHTSLGDSVPVQVTFSATGGTVTSSGLYTAGVTPGSYRLIASADGVADTAALTLSAPPPGPTPPPIPTGAGLPFGMSQQLSRFGSPAAPMTMTADGMTASTLIPRINAARAGGYKLIVNLTGGGHAAYMSTIDGVYQFDESKWYAQMETYNTATIRQAVAQAVADGTIVGSSVMDEPYVSGGANGGGNTWGPKGTMTKARVDTLCGMVKQMFPTLPAGVAHQHDQFEPTKSYRVCDFIIDQYDWRRGDVTAFRDAGLAMGQRDRHAIMFGINVLDGGVQDKDGNYTCDGPGQGGKGTYAPNCRMTPQQVRDWGLLLGKAGCGLYMWRADAQFMANSANVQSLRDLASGLGAMPGKGCYRN
jgi:hypothetical protein